MTAISPFDFIKSINSKTYKEDIAGFSPYLTNKVYSVHEHWVHLANAINLLGNSRLSPRAIYDFYFCVIPKNRRWLAYPKTIKDPKTVGYLMEWFGVNEQQARDYLDLIEKDELKEIITYFEKRGVK